MSKSLDEKGLGEAHFSIDGYFRIEDENVPSFADKKTKPFIGEPLTCDCQDSPQERADG